VTVTFFLSCSLECVACLPFLDSVVPVPPALINQSTADSLVHLLRRRRERRVFVNETRGKCKYESKKPVSVLVVEHKEMRARADGWDAVTQN
jgi:hypothetical protein